jgi:hypothetical protein
MRSYSHLSRADEDMMEDSVVLAATVALLRLARNRRSMGNMDVTLRWVEWRARLMAGRVQSLAEGLPA